MNNPDKKLMALHKHASSVPQHKTLKIKTIQLQGQNFCFNIEKGH